MRIEVGMGMEDKLTDMKCSLILKNNLKLYFKNNQFNMGIKSGLASIINIVSGGSTATQLFPNVNKNILIDNITPDPSKVDESITKAIQQHPIVNMIVIGFILIILIFIGIRYPKLFGLVFWIIIAILNSRGGGRGGSSGGFLEAVDLLEEEAQVIVGKHSITLHLIYYLTKTQGDKNVK